MFIVNKQERNFQHKRIIILMKIDWMIKEDEKKDIEIYVIYIFRFNIHMYFFSVQQNVSVSTYTLIMIL